MKRFEAEPLSHEDDDSTSGEDEDDDDVDEDVDDDDNDEDEHVGDGAEEDSDDDEVDNDEFGYESDDEEEDNDKFGDDDDGGGGDDDDDDEETNNSKSGLANVMAKILSTKKSDDVILSKAKKDWAVKKEEDSDEDNFEVVDSSGKVKIEPKIISEIKEEPEHISIHKRQLMHKLREERFRVKPDLQKDHEKERKLKIIATQGVVQLFSAIEKHKTMIQKKLSETRSIMGKEKVMETTGKEEFMKVLRQQGKKIKRDDDEDKVKNEVKEEPIDIPVAKKPKWNVFADNFYKEPTLQGWDQQSDDNAD